MRIVYCLILITSLQAVIYGQTPLSSSPSQDQNYILNNTVLVEGIKDPLEIPQKLVEEIAQRVEYFDGLGRPIQTINTKASPTYNDVVQPLQYDAFGRQTKSYLPYSTSATPGAFKANAINDNTGSYMLSGQYLFYQNADNVAHDQAPFSEVLLENSSLNRVLKEGAPGTTWQPLSLEADDRTTEKKYLANGPEEVLLFSYDMNTNSLTMKDGVVYYEANQLYANRTIDENNHEVIEYIDKEGKTVLKKVECNEENGLKSYAETYYIYDDFGNLIVVLPPEAVASLKSSISSN